MCINSNDNNIIIMCNINNINDINNINNDNNNV